MFKTIVNASGKDREVTVKSGVIIQQGQALSMVNGEAVLATGAVPVFAIAQQSITATAGSKIRATIVRPEIDFVANTSEDVDETVVGTRINVSSANAGLLDPTVEGEFLVIEVVDATTVIGIFTRPIVIDT
ncbi:MAG: hypothetical protein LBG59_07530 [Candidatus Peribacteria bacterium]|nr:hypothetical protein [Candidatus Peribacteria bacterium]